MTQFTVKKSEIKDGLAPVFYNLPASAILPSLEWIGIRAKNNLSFFSTDLETSITYLPKIDLNSDFEFFGNGEFIYNFITRALSDYINVTVKSGRIEMSSGEFKATSQEKNKDDYPLIKSVTPSNVIIVNSHKLCAQIKNALSFVSNDDLRISMTGILFEYTGEKLNIVSTDGHRLYFNTLPLESKNKNPFRFILPPKSAKIILKSLKSEEPIEIRVEGLTVEFKSLEYSIVCKTIDANYPAWESVIPKNNYKFFLLRKDLKSFLQLASKFVDKITNQIIIHIQDGKIFFSGGSRDYDEEFEYKIPLHGESDIFNVRFAINSKFFLSALQVNKKDHAVSFAHFGDAHKAIVIDSCVLLMPLMLNEF